MKEKNPSLDPKSIFYGLKNVSVRNLTPEQQRAELEAKPNRDILEEMALNLMRHVEKL